MNEIGAKQEFFETIRALSEAVPSMRLSQLIATIGEVCSDLHGRGLWDAEDQELLEAAWKFQKDIESDLPAELHPTT